MAIYDGQHLVLMKWIFSMKTDETYKARLVGRGDLMLPWIDFNPKEIYCGNISACRITLVLAIVSSYKLRMRGGDLVGAYLVTRANKDYQRNRGTTWHMHTSSRQLIWIPTSSSELQH